MQLQTLSHFPEEPSCKFIRFYTHFMSSSINFQHFLIILLNSILQSIFIRDILYTTFRSFNMDKSCFFCDKNFHEIRTFPKEKLSEHMNLQIQNHGIGMEIICDAEEKQDTYSTSGFRSFDFYILCHICAGEGRLFLKRPKMEYRLSPSNVFILEPDTPHIISGVTAGFKKDFIFFAGPEIDIIAKHGLIKRGILSWDIHKRIKEIFNKKKIETAENYIQAQIMLQMLLLDINANFPLRNKDITLIKLIDEITAFPGKNWTVAEMAAFCGYSTAQLRRNFIKYTGKLPKNYVDEIKLGKSAELLSEGMTIDEVYQKIGFQDRFHFCRRFKEFFNIPPHKFKCLSDTEKKRIRESNIQ